MLGDKNLDSKEYAISNDELWEIINWKVYTKLYGSYAALASVFIDDRLFDLTRLTSKKMVKDLDKTNNSNESDKLWHILLTNSTLEHNNKNNKQKDKIISAKYYTRNKIWWDPQLNQMVIIWNKKFFYNYRHTGILVGHAYSILDVFEISKPRRRKRKKSRLIRKEWNGKWSDDSVETKKNKELIENELNKKYNAKFIKLIKYFNLLCWVKY